MPRLGSGLVKYFEQGAMLLQRFEELVKDTGGPITAVAAMLKPEKRGDGAAAAAGPGVPSKNSYGISMIFYASRGRVLKHLKS